ncbi:MAG TPA: LuxR C-terminal-related transcriptional regulator [Actinomycetota bacterium]
MSRQDHLAAGQAALAAGRWEEARAAFRAALAEAETPEALDGLGVALWWLGETQASVAATERAYAGFRRAGDAAGAAGAALFLCITWASNFDNHAVAGGWLARAERVAGEVGQTGPGPLEGWLLLLRGFLEPDPERAHALVRQVLELARETGDVDLELCAMGDLGVSLVAAGREADGMALIDEAMAGTLGGEHRRLDTVVITCCDMLVACDLAGDLRRATQWCQVADRFINRYGCPFLYARCRTLYGSVLLARGRWAEAERELLAAVRMAEGTGPGAYADALARLAELRLRQGRLEEAEGLLPERGGGRAAARTAARLRLAAGEPSVAAGLLERSLEDHGEPQIHGEQRLRAAAALETLVAARVALGELDAAAAAAARIPELAADGGDDQVAALAALASARLATARERPEAARRSLERALELFGRLDLPYEVAQVRLELARVLAAADPEMAVAEATAARDALERLGAAADADAADALRRSLGARGRTGPKRVGTLTRREQEVLRLVGLGLSNPEIAQRLFISRKTAAHHVSNVLAKLGVRNRAGAIAYATRQAAGRD